MLSRKENIVILILLASFLGYGIYNFYQKKQKKQAELNQEIEVASSQFIQSLNILDSIAYKYSGPGRYEFFELSKEGRDSVSAAIFENITSVIDQGTKIDAIYDSLSVEPYKTSFYPHVAPVRSFLHANPIWRLQGIENERRIVFYEMVNPEHYVQLIKLGI